MNVTANRVSEWDGAQLATRNGSGGMIEVASTRAAQEVQAAMVVAKKFPRDETASYGRIMRACQRRTLAEQALYAYPKGGQTVTGPSIRLAEAMAQAWGNVDFGIIELEQKRGESTVMAYAWDLETNTRQTKIFAVKHERHTKRGVADLTDPRDIYELTANQGARRLRACILGVIPGDVVDAAVAECEKTMTGNNREPLADRIRQMVVTFSEMGVTQEMIEGRLGHKVEATTETEIVQLKKVYRSLRDNMASVTDFFDVPGAKPTQEAAGLSAKLADEPEMDPDAFDREGAAATETKEPAKANPSPLSWDQVSELAVKKAPAPIDEGGAIHLLTKIIRETYCEKGDRRPIKTVWDAMTAEEKTAVEGSLNLGEFPWT